MNLNPKLQKKLFTLDVNFNELSNLYDNNELPPKILLTGPKGSGKSTLAYHFINYIFSKNEEFNYDKKSYEINENNKSFKLIQSNCHQNFYLIDLLDDKKIIEISQVRKMIEYSNKSNFNNLPKVILIDNVENLNINSVNALLKIIEEPNQNTYFILIHNSNKKILDTLKSRCLKFNISLNFDKCINVTNSLIKKNILENVSYDLINYYSTPGYYVNLINFSNNNNIDLSNYKLKDFLLYLLNGNFYKKDDFVKNYIYDLIELYFLKTIVNAINKEKIFFIYKEFISKIYNVNKFNLDNESLFMEFKDRVLND